MREAPPGTGSPEAPRAIEKAIYAGGHGEVAIPVPIPNTEVKHLCADDTAESGKVGSCRLFYFKFIFLGQGVTIPPAFAALGVSPRERTKAGQ